MWKYFQRSASSVSIGRVKRKLTNAWNGKKAMNALSTNHLKKSVNLTHTQDRRSQKENALDTFRNASNHTGKKLSDGKGIGRSKGRLTDKVMNTLQNHYGMAIRQNTQNLYAMKRL